MAADSTFATIFVGSKESFLTFPIEKRHYEVSFFLVKDSNVPVKDCNVIVDNDDMNPLVSRANIGNIPRACRGRAKAIACATASRSVRGVGSEVFPNENYLTPVPQQAVRQEQSVG
jgi:hypothetical protein